MPKCFFTTMGALVFCCIWNENTISISTVILERLDIADIVVGCRKSKIKFEILKINNAKVFYLANCKASESQNISVH